MAACPCPTPHLLSQSVHQFGVFVAHRLPGSPCVLLKDTAPGAGSPPGQVPEGLGVQCLCGQLLSEVSVWGDQ